jgi:hypothetical protein
MENQAHVVGPLKKVLLDLTLTSPTRIDNGRTSILFDFIYGLGSAGITPFEKALFGKSPQDAIELHVGSDQAALVFGHLTCDFLQRTCTTPPFDLHAVIKSVETPDNREVIKAMAKSTGCGDGCDCGCGC